MTRGIVFADVCLHLDDPATREVIPEHAGAQMDLARAYYAAGSFDLAEAAFQRLRSANPPAPTLAAINRYLDAIKARRHEATTPIVTT